MQQKPHVLEQCIPFWQQFLKQHNWRTLIKDVTPKHSGCGIVYDLPPLPDHPNESLAIADMRHLFISEPHYHPAGNPEIYFVLQGSGRMMLGNQERTLQGGDIITIPPLTAHYVIPHAQLIIGAVISPPFMPEHYIALTHTNHAVGFDEQQFKRLCAQVK